MVIPLDFMVERGHLMAIFKLVDFVEVLDRWCTRKVMRLVCIVVVKFQAAGTQWVLWHPLEEGYRLKCGGRHNRNCAVGYASRAWWSGSTSRACDPYGAAAEL